MTKLKIGLSYWGVCADFNDHRVINVDTPDGHRYGRPLLVKALLDAGHEVYALQQRREPSGYPHVKYVMDHGIPIAMPEAMFPELDVVFLEWRWSTYKNDRTHEKFSADKYEPDLDRQREIIEFYKGKVPIIAWDTDLKITPDDEERYPELIIADPSFNPVLQTRKRVSLPFWSDWQSLFPVKEHMQLYGYVGNNYERHSEFVKYYFRPAHELRKFGIQTSMYGNWLNVSPERSHPADMIAMYRDVAFNHRMGFYDSMHMLNNFICTTHVSKDSYYRAGFISPRYLEAIACGCPALVPSSQIYNGALGRDWIVYDERDVVEKVKKIEAMSLSERIDAVKHQRDTLKASHCFDVENVVSFIESVVK